jgi:hypothetical protein
MSSKNEIILYHPNANAAHIEVQMKDETVWLNKNQMALLFERDVKTIGKHINNIFRERELEKEVVVANLATTMKHGAIKGTTLFFSWTQMKLNLRYRKMRYLPNKALVEVCHLLLQNRAFVFVAFYW